MFLVFLVVFGTEPTAQLGHQDFLLPQFLTCNVEKVHLCCERLLEPPSSRTCRGAQKSMLSLCTIMLYHWAPQFNYPSTSWFIATRLALFSLPIFFTRINAPSLPHSRWEPGSGINSRCGHLSTRLFFTSSSNRLWKEDTDMENRLFHRFAVWVTAWSHVNLTEWRG